MKRIFLFVIFLLTFRAHAQVKIGDNPTTLQPSALLELESASKALLIPRVSNPATGIATPVNGMIVYDTTLNCFRGYQSNGWSGCNFVTVNTTSGGSAVISSITIGDQAGTITNETVVPAGVTQTLTVNATAVGNYELVATSTVGVTFRGSGQLVLGNNTVVLTATGTANAPLPATPYTGYVASFTIESSANTNTSFQRTIVWKTIPALCGSSNATTVQEITSTTGKVWMDRNLGASRAAESSNDYKAYGCLYQWGRGNDGHASVDWLSASTATFSNTTSTRSDAPGHGNFITNSGGDWRNTPSNALWQANNPVNNPCPTGFRVPTRQELIAERTAYPALNSSTGAFSSPFKIPSNPSRETTGVYYNTSQNNDAFEIWTSTVNGNQSYSFWNGGSDPQPRARGYAVRCIKEYTNPQTGGNAEVSAWTNNGAFTGEMFVGRSIASGTVKKVVVANVATPGTYSIETDTVHGVKFAGSGTFTGTGNQNVTLTATGTPTVPAGSTFPLSTTFPVRSVGGTAELTSFTDPIKINPTTNGTAEFTFTETTTPSGTLAQGTAATGVSQTLNITVVTPGSYSFTTTANGVTFAGSGTVTAGQPSITLTATGTPNAGGANINFSLNTNPAFAFTRAITSSTSSGTAVLSVTNTNKAENGNLLKNRNATGVTHTITVNVTSAGSYNFTTTAAPSTNVIYSKSGNFDNPGTYDVVLEATGTPTAQLDAVTFSTNGINFTKAVYIGAICDGITSTTIVDVFNPDTNKTWMDRNLGATSTDTSTRESYGCFYQWGRGNDGHASMLWSSASQKTVVNGTTTKSDNPTPAPINNSGDWRVTSDNSLWLAGSANNPCPPGYRVPTLAELQAENAFGNFSSAANASAGALKLPRAGKRWSNSGGGITYESVGSVVMLWTRDPGTTPKAKQFVIQANGASSNDLDRAEAMPVRCIKQ